jgi:cytochrome c oxidase subunit IV
MESQPYAEREMSERILGQPTYYAVFVALIILTFVTVGVSFLPLGQWHTIAGLAIATCKALLVVLFFMHVLYSSRLTWVVILVSLFWLAVMIGLTMSDYLTRQWLAY